MSSTHPSRDADESSAYGLTEAGVAAVVEEHRDFDFEGNRASAVGGAIRMLEGCVEYLQAQGEVYRRDLVDAIYQPTGDCPKPSQGLYIRLQGDEWFEDVGAPQLSRLPCVEAVDDGDRWRFDSSGVDPEALDDEHVAPLEELTAAAST